MVEFNGVSKSFLQTSGLFRTVRRETHALRNVSFSVQPGKVFVLLGPNGSGKTTILRLISTLLTPDAGSVRVCGHDTRAHEHSARRSVGFAVANERSFYPRLTAAENLHFFAALDDIPGHGRDEVIAQVLEQVELQHEAGRQVMTFSSGMYQRLGIARALLKSPSVLLLDEPSRSLDPASCIRFWKLVRAQAARGATVVMTTHNFEEAIRAGDEVGVLNAGSLLATERITSGEEPRQLRDFYFRHIEPSFATWENEVAR